MNNSTTLNTLRDQAIDIYSRWVNGNTSTAIAMLHQIPNDRTAYVVMTMTMFAIDDGYQYSFSRFIEGATR